MDPVQDGGNANNTPGENQDPKNQGANQNGAELEKDSEELKQAEDFILNFKDEDYEDDDKVEELKKAQKLAKTTIQQKRHWREKAQKAGTGDNPKPPVNNGQQPSDRTPDNQAGKDSENRELSRVIFRQDFPDLPKDKVDEAFDEVYRYAKAHGMKIQDAAQKPLIKSYLAQVKADSEVDAASPKPSGASKMQIPKTDWKNADSKTVKETREQILRNARSRGK